MSVPQKYIAVVCKAAKDSQEAVRVAWWAVAACGAILLANLVLAVLLWRAYGGVVE